MSSDVFYLSLIPIFGVLYAIIDLHQSRSRKVAEIVSACANKRGGFFSLKDSKGGLMRKVFAELDHTEVQK